MKEILCLLNNLDRIGVDMLLSQKIYSYKRILSAYIQEFETETLGYTIHKRI